MNLSEADLDFVRALVKTARQRSQHVRWVDRDGSERITTLSAEDARRLADLAKQAGSTKDALLRRAAELPALRNPEKR